MLTSLGVLVLLVAGSVYALWLPQLRVQDVRVEGPRAEEARLVAETALSGTYAHVLPKDSILFFPKNGIRRAVLAAYPEISALSISRTSASAIALTGTPRAKAFVWCGTSLATAYPDSMCFDADAEGLVFKAGSNGAGTTTLSTGSTTPSASPDLRILSPLEKELAEGESPVGTRVVNAAAIPDALRFVKAVRGLGVPVASLQLRGDEADLWVTDATRITYVLGHEQEAANLAASVVTNLSLTGGGIEYLDLRFGGKAYVKRYGTQ